MNTVIAKKIQEMVDLETEGWNTKNPDLFLSIIHPDMAWPWPPTADAHDPIGWVFVLGRFDRGRWRKNWQEIFDSHDLIRNQRGTVKIEVSNEQMRRSPWLISIPSGGIRPPRKISTGRAESARYTQSCRRANGNSISKQGPLIFHPKGLLTKRSRPIAKSAG
jgi:hypothetical protein